ncbi:alpha/beta hydrolase [Streptomyces sp. GS7]|uniref:alpha/beta hydrolase n=1 Tax=Streptomyces sp. GS7 TaxID=2692234 RepID=UPI0013192C09|nr:alpha/beta hydrolase [Streptomyces sp. GS7]QHC22349.1 alpha/beta fold hydrolase [Streptomyces sp. GS7]
MPGGRAPWRTAAPRRAAGAGRCVRGAVAALAAFALAGALTGAVAPAADGAGTPVPVPNPGLARFYQQRPAWERCPPDVLRSGSSGQGTPRPGYADRLQCARLEVPRDYAHPGQATLRVQLIRLAATGPGKRLGSLVINPGGPGDSGVNYLVDNADAFAHLGQRYDLVSFDPRGTGRTEPISCGTTFTPVTGAGAQSLGASEQRLNEACGRYSGPLLPWVGTPDVARDMDVLRSALRDARLNYLGFSYGTRLGAVYAHEFPRNVGRMALDSVEDPTKNTWQTAVAQARGFQRAVDAFATDCVHGSACPLGTDTKAAQDQLTKWYRNLTDHPLQAQGTTVDQTTYVYALRGALYSRETWPALHQALAQLRNGDGSGILNLSGSGSGSGSGSAAGRARRDASGRLPSQEQLALRAISCRDTSERYGPADFPRAQRELTQASPLFGPDIAPTLLDCYGWPVAGDDASRQVAAPHAPPLLLVATTDDPATPYEGAANMARALGNASPVLTYHGEGHAAYTSGNPCVLREVDGFLLGGALPVGGAGCR